MHGCLDVLSGDLNLLSGAWVFCLQRDEEGIVGRRARRWDSVPLARVLPACQLRPLAGTCGPILCPWLGESLQVTLSREQAL